MKSFKVLLRNLPEYKIASFYQGMQRLKSLLSMKTGLFFLICILTFFAYIAYKEARTLCTRRVVRWV